MRPLQGVLFFLAAANTFAATIPVSNLQDNGPGSLRQAIVDANASPGADVISISSTGTIVLCSPLPTVTENLVIDGPGADLTRVSGSNAFRVFAFAAGTTNSISRLSLVDGFVTNNLNGGAIYNDGELAVSSCVFSNNQTAGGWGGAIYSSGNLQLNDSRFESNSALGQDGGGTQKGGSGGGAAGFGGALFCEIGNLTATNCVFANNRTVAGAGGAAVGHGTIEGGNGGGVAGGRGSTSVVDGGPGGFGCGGGGGVGSSTNNAPTTGGVGGFGGGAGGGGAGSSGGYGGGAGGTHGTTCGGYEGGGGGGGGGAFGGAIFARSNAVLAVSCVFSNNSAQGGNGGIAYSGGYGGSGFGGAAFFLSCTAELIGATAVANTSIGGTGGATLGSGSCGGSAGGNGSANGGSVAIDRGALLARDCMFFQNSASGSPAQGPLVGGCAYGGAIFADDATLNLSSSTVFSNCAAGAIGGYTTHLGGKGGSAQGGAIAVTATASANLTNVTISGNRAVGANGLDGQWNSSAGGDASGAGLAIGGMLNGVNLTVVSNVASAGVGGAILVSEGTQPDGNALGGGIYSTGTVYILNSILSHNKSSSNAPDGFGTFTSAGHNLIGATNGLSGLADSDLVGQDPKLGPLLNNGGPTWTHAFTGPSPAVDGGDSAGAPWVDQRGVARPQARACDIGAFEIAPLSILVDGAVVTESVIRSHPATISFVSMIEGGPIVYTLDGTEPGPTSQLYTGPFTITSNTVPIRAMAYSADFSQTTLAGPLQVTILPSYSLNTSVQGSGTISINPSGNVFPSGTVVTLTATAAPDWYFGYWTGAVTSSNHLINITVNTNKSVQAVFLPIPRFTLDLSVQGGGTATALSNGPYLSNSTVTVVASALPGWIFVGWSGDLAGTNATSSILMNSNRAACANFAKLHSFNVGSPGGGSVTPSLPNGLYPEGTVISVTAIASNGWTWMRWQGDISGDNSTTNIVLDRDLTLQAVFGTTLTLTPASHGTIIAEPSAPLYAYGSTVRLSAQPEELYAFSLWGNAVLGNTSPIFLSITNTNPRVSALFHYVGAEMAIQTNGNGRVTPDYNGRLLEIGNTYTVSAIPEPGYVFLNWTGGIASESPELTFVMQSNLVLIANFIPNPLPAAKGAYLGLFAPSNSLSVSNSGYLAATLATNGVYSGRIILASRTNSFSGRLSERLTGSNYLRRTGLNPVSLTLKLDMNGRDQLVGRVSDGEWTADLVAIRSVSRAEAARFTLAIAGDDSGADAPAGEGIGTVALAKTGALQFNARLADGTRVSQSSAPSQLGTWPVYANLYAGKGMLFGWMTLTNRESDDLHGVLRWIRMPQARTRFYTHGFDVPCETIGSRYLQPARNSRIIDISAGEISFANGNLVQSFTNEVLMLTNSRVKNLSGNWLSVTNTLATGLFNGAVKVPGTSRRLQFNGAYLQKCKAGFGFFLDTNRTGRVLLQSAP